MRYVPSVKQVKERCTSVKAWELPKQDSALAPEGVWSNSDMDPVKPENRTWSIWTWFEALLSCSWEKLLTFCR